MSQAGLSTSRILATARNLVAAISKFRELSRSRADVSARAPSFGKPASTGRVRAGARLRTFLRSSTRIVPKPAGCLYVPVLEGRYRYAGRDERRCRRSTSPQPLRSPEEFPRDSAWSPTTQSQHAQWRVAAPRHSPARDMRAVCAWSPA